MDNLEAQLKMGQEQVQLVLLDWKKKLTMCSKLFFPLAFLQSPQNEKWGGINL
jgi:hypothetical protein